MLVFDAHLDLAWNAIDWNRDLLQPVAEIRSREKEAGLTDKGRCCNTVSFPELRRGKVAIFIATLLGRLYRIGGIPVVQRFASMEAAYAAAQGQMAYYRALEKTGVIRWIKDRATLDEHIAEWEAFDALPPHEGRGEKVQSEEPPLGMILSMEGADPVLSPEQVQEWFDAGLRIIGPAHYGPSPYARGHDMTGGLYERGPALLREMDRVGIILDITHLSDDCFYEALEIYGGPILASHHNCRELVPNARQLTDDQIKRIVARGGVIGTALDTWMLVPGWIRSETTPEKAGVTLAAMIDHIDRVCQIAGNARHAAIGTDLDGGYGKEQSPLDLDTIADLQKVPDLLRNRGYKDDDVKGIMYRNWVRFFKEAWSRRC
jgi:membrane dipeptidase